MVTNRNLLVTMCNQIDHKKSGLVRIDMSSDKCEWVDTGVLTGLRKWFGRGGIKGCTGIVADGDCIYVLTRYNGNKVVVLDKNTLKPIGVNRLDEVRAAHSVVARDGKLYIVSTGTDEVIRYNMDGASVRYEGVEWRASDKGTDTNHINSILIYRDDILVSGFGEKDGPLWKDAKNGFIYNISKKEYVVNDIHHPHTACSNGSELFYCNSREKLFTSCDGHTSIHGNGYVRGASFLASDIVAIGSSMGRRVSQSTKVTIENPIGPGNLVGECGVTVYDLNTNKMLEKYDLAGFSSEIYDVYAL